MTNTEPVDQRIVRVIAAAGARGITSSRLAERLGRMPDDLRAETLGELALTGRVRFEQGAEGEIIWRRARRCEADADVDARAEVKAAAMARRRVWAGG